MIKKQGITLTTVVVTVIILIILATAISVSTYSTLNYARISTWVNEISHIQSVVDEARDTTSALPYTSEIVKIDLSTLSSEQVNVQFAGENIVDNSVELNILNLGVLKITNTVYGKLDSTNDVYAYSTTTGKVYYAGGFEIDGEVYYTFTEALRDRFNLAPANRNLSSVVFVPSVIGYTNEPITLTVKLPNSFSNISITTSNNQIEVGTQTIEDNMYKYIINNNKIAGNYEVTVSYSDGTQSYTTKYTVNSYDTEKPEIAEITEENFVTIDNVPYITNIQATDESGIKHLKYTPGVISQQDAKAYFSTNGNNVINGKINLGKEVTEYTIYAEDNAGNFTIITFAKTDAWKENVIAIVNGVPIPKGFVASPYGANGEIKAENTKDGGLVIYELNEGETEIPSYETQFESWTERNQYVWVPVNKDNFVTEFVRKDYIYEPSQVVDADGKYNALGTNYWEVIVDEATNLPKTTIAEQSAMYMSPDTLAEVQAMYASVKKYGGFYIARYEAGVDEKNLRTSDSAAIVKTLANVHSKMNKIPYNYIKWSTSSTMNVDTEGAVEVARSMYTSDTTDENYTKYGVVSTLTYGVQWDRVVQWYIDTRAMEVTTATGSTANGNYYDHDIASYTELNTGAKYSDDFGKSYGNVVEGYTKGSDTEDEAHLLTTGALKAANVNNIYDMAGNIYEWTMEGGSTGGRAIRGGSLYVSGSNYPVAYRGFNSPYNAGSLCGFRPSLYIKK